MSKEQIGTLVVVVLKARNLNDKHSLYKQDVFATVSLHGTEKRTPVDVKGGQHPEWDAEVRFPVCKDEGGKERKLEVACFAKEPRSDELLGKGVVDIAETLKTGEFDDWVPLDINGVVRGDIYLEMTYFSASPPVGGLKPPTNTFTLQRRPSKLSPSDRLSRPPTLAPSINSIPEERLHQSEFHARPYTQANMPKSEVIPDILRPAGVGRVSKPIAANSVVPSTLPSILRPGNPNVTTIFPPSPSYRAQKTQVVQPTSHYQLQQPQMNDHLIRPGYSTFQQSPPYHSSVANPTPQPPMNSYSAVSKLGSSQWSAEEPMHGPLSFPVPSGPAVIDPQRSHAHSSSTNSSNSSYPSASSPLRNDGRYRSPPGSGHHDYTSPLVNPYTGTPPSERYQSPLPLPNDTRREDVLPAPRNASPIPNKTRIDDLRLAEEQAAKRKAQEDKDLELALKLDQELNLMEEEASRRPSESQIPGSWQR